MNDPLPQSTSLLLRVSLVPGAAAFAPWAIWIHDQGWSPTTTEAWIIAVVFIAIAQAIGTILDAGAGFVEGKYIDDRLCSTKKYRQFKVVWRRYLSLNVDPEPIGQRYIRVLLVRMKFLLNLALAVPVSAIGIVVAGHLWNPWLILVVSAAFVLTWLGYNESYETAKSLHKVRRVLVKHYYNGEP